MNPEPVAAAPETPTAEITVQQTIEQRWAEHLAGIADAERMRIAKAKNLFGPSVEPTREELRLAVPLEGDTIRYAKDKDGKPRIAPGRNGLGGMVSRHGHGRKKKHMTKAAQAIKSASIASFRLIFGAHRAGVAAQAAADNKEFVGVPEQDIAALGAKAAALGHRTVKLNAAAARRRARNRSKLSRKINRGVLPGNTNVRRYIA